MSVNECLARLWVKIGWKGGFLDENNAKFGEKRERKELLGFEN